MKTKITGITKVVSEKLGEFDIFHTTTRGIPMDFIPAHQVDDMLISQVKKFNKGAAFCMVITTLGMAAISFLAYKCGQIKSEEG